MSPLPLISHRLFVEAIKDEDGAARKPAWPETSSCALAEEAHALPLEVMNGSEAMPADATRPLRASLALGGA